MTDLIATMRRHGVTVDRLAQATDRTVATVINWQAGMTRPPAYIALTVEAVARGLPPVTHDRMYAHQLTEIGVPKETEWTWRYNRKFSTACRLAVALIEWRKKNPRVTPYEKTIIGNVEKAGRYYRTRGGWRARPVMGKTPPTLKLKTPLDLERRGYLKITDGVLTVTPKGRDVHYGKN